jgi:hypothetical protein
VRKMLSTCDIRGFKKCHVATANSKLGNNAEKDWNLVGIKTDGPSLSRTRGGGNGRPNYNIRKKQFNEPKSEETYSEPEWKEEDEDEDNEESYDDDDALTSGDESIVESVKPSATRVLFEVDSLVDTLEKHCRCVTCGGPMKSELKSTCLATNIRLTCTKCGYIHYSHPAASASVGDPDAAPRERTTDYAVNVLYVLGFIAAGDGCTEAGKLLGLQGLPNDTTMESCSFTAIEERISPYIQELTEDILHENLEAEVKATARTPNVFALWQQAHKGILVLDHENYPLIKASYDMAWQQRNSGNRYNSASGHALFVGGTLRQPISLLVKSRHCNVCSTWSAKHDINLDPVPPHKSAGRIMKVRPDSGSMEPQACLEMTIHMFEKKFCKRLIQSVLMMMHLPDQC